MDKEKIIYSIKGLPSFPSTALKAIKTIKDPYCSAQDLVEVIQYDQNITANVLRFANSAYFGRQSKITSLKQAVAFLGSKEIMNMILISGLLSYTRVNYDGYGITGEDLLIHSVATGLMCRILADKIGIQDPSSLFTAGLLHDIGKTVLNSFVHDKYDEINDLIEDSGYSLVLAEREVLGMDHAAVGEKVMREWGFPDEIVTPVAFHHNFESSEKDDVSSAVVFLSDQLYVFIKGVPGAEIWSFRKMKNAMKRCALTEEDLDISVAELKQSLTHVQDMLQT